MLVEIILLIFLCRAIGSTMRNKGRSAIGFQILMVVMLFAGEFMGGLVYGIYAGMTNTPIQPGFNPEILLFAVLGGGAGVAMTFVIAALVPSLQRPSYAPIQYASSAPDFAQPQPSSSNPYNAYDTAPQVQRPQYQ